MKPHAALPAVTGPLNPCCLEAILTAQHWMVLLPAHGELAYFRWTTAWHLFSSAVRQCLGLPCWCVHL